ncbi:MAG TPA: tetratricopeptide repeat protein [Spirochaetota bacterium]|nr:tetratricopeptide repeat protein [Spirochaetota bacterium]HPS85560.1 tetratricopeptide repeat protein [Spirochaetota bacterium]
MKRIIGLILLLICININLYADTASGGDGLTLYSEALYYKNLALQSEKPEERDNYLDKAIGMLEKAKGSGHEEGRVYYQLSEIYFLKGDIAASEKSAGIAIEKDSKYFPPYNRLYGIMMDRKEYKEAAAVIEKYLAADPDDPYALYLLGVHYFKYLNDTDKSLTFFEREIFISKSRDVLPYYLENSYYNIGYIYFSKNENSKAFPYFIKAYGLNDSNQNTVYMLALSAFGYYNLPDAEKYSMIYLKKVPGDVNMEYILGSVYYINENEKAMEYLSRVKRSRTFEGLVAMGLYYELAGEDSKADTIINSVLKYREDLIAPYIAAARIKFKGEDKADAYKALISAGTICFRNNVFDAAEKLFYKALGLKGDENSDIYYFLARTHEENKNYSMAISYYNKYYSISKESNVLVHIGYIYGTQSKYGRAYDYFLKAVKKDPENPGAYFFWGLVQIWEGKNSAGRDNILRAISIKNDEETYYFYLAVAYEKLGDINKSIENLKLAINYNKNSGRSYNYLGYIYADKNINIDEGLTLVQKALEIEPDNGAYLDSLGWIYYRKGDYVAALKNLLLAEEKLDEAGIPDYVVYDHLGDTYLKIDNKNKAVYYWEKAVKLEKDAAIDEKLKMYREQKNGK